MKTRSFAPIAITIIVAFNLIASVIIITNGYKTIKSQKTLITKEKTQHFISTLIYYS